MKGQGAKRDEGHNEIWHKRGEKLARKVEWIAGMLVEIDDLLDAWGGVLDVSQPLKSGKMGLRWWRLSGKSEMREPVLVEWKRGKDRRFFPVRVEPSSFCRRIKRGGGFAVNVEVTREVAHYVVEALRMRVMLRRILVEDFGRDGGALGRHADVIGFQSARAVELRGSLKPVKGVRKG